MNAPIFTVDLGEEFGSYEQRVRAPFHLWIQNTADPNHLEHVHPEFRRMFTSGCTPHNVDLMRSYSEYSMSLSPDVVRRFEKYVTNQHWARMEFTHMLFYPHLSVTSFMGIFFSVETAIPDREDETYTSVNTRFFVAPESKVSSLMKKMALEGNIRLLKEDKAFMESWANQYNNKAGFWMPGEERIKHYLNWCEMKGLFDE
jgi:hypothetical protein